MLFLLASPLIMFHLLLLLDREQNSRFVLLEKRVNLVSVGVSLTSASPQVVLILLVSSWSDVERITSSSIRFPLPGRVYMLFSFFTVPAFLIQSSRFILKPSMQHASSRCELLLQQYFCYTNRELDIEQSTVE